MKEVIILTINYNQADYTVKCLESLLESKYSNYKILLVDNGSTKENYEDLSKRLPSEPKLLFKRLEKNRGYVGGMNYALETARKLNPDYFLVMNNDTILDPDAVNELVAVAGISEDNAIVTGKVYDFHEKNVFQHVGSELINEKFLRFKPIASGEEDKGNHDEVCERDLIDDIFWLFPTVIYDDIGGYNPLFFFNGESADLALRARKKGYKLIYAPKAKLWHKGSVSVGGRENNPYLSFWQMKSTLTFRYLHLTRSYFVRFYFTKLYQIGVSYTKNFIRLLSFKKTHFKLSNAMLKGFSKFTFWMIFHK